jgi:hypothetical protein
MRTSSIDPPRAVESGAPVEKMAGNGRKEMAEMAEKWQRHPSLEREEKMAETPIFGERTATRSKATDRTDRDTHGLGVVNTEPPDLEGKRVMRIAAREPSIGYLYST